MTITRETHPYEILIRLGAGEQPFVGAHAIDLERVVDGDEVLAERTLPARPITLADLADLLDEKHGALLEQVAAATDDATTQRERANNAEALVEGLTEAATSSRAVIEQLRAQNAMLSASLAATTGQEETAA